jgi:DNA-binding NtrC family response regulator
MSERPYLVSIVEMGGYPDFSALYRQAGFEPLTERNMRKALGLIKKKQPRVVVAEFNYQSDFRDRTSNLETLMARLQRHPQVKVIAFYQSEYQHKFDNLCSRFPIFEAIPFPVDPKQVEAALRRALALPSQPSIQA